MPDKPKSRRRTVTPPESDPSLDVNEQLLLSRERLRAVLDTAVDAIITIDHDGVITDINPAATKMFGYTKDEMIGQNVKMLMPSPYKEEHDGYVQRYLKNREPRIIGIGRESVARRKDGSTFPIQLAVSEVDHHEIFTGVVRDLTAQKTLEKAIADRMTVEQRETAQELHDGPAQQLTGLSMLGRVLQSKLEAERSPHADDMAEINKLVHDVHYNVRNIMKGMQPVDVEAGGLETALQDLADSTRDRYNVRCLFKSDGLLAPPDNNTATQLYYIAREAVVNAVKYSSARKIIVSAQSVGGQLRLTVTDDGVGLSGPSDQVAGMGMRIMRYRSSLIGAMLDIQSEQGQGTTVSCTLEIGKR